jgi:hypothetical protein
MTDQQFVRFTHKHCGRSGPFVSSVNLRRTFHQTDDSQLERLLVLVNNLVERKRSSILERRREYNL